MTMKKTLASLLAASTLAAPGYSQGALYTINQSGGVQGTALNSTSVIGAGSGQATAVNLANGSQLVLGTTGNTVDAGQYNNNVNMYLNNSGVLNFVDNQGNTYNFLPGQSAVGLSGATAVSSAVNVNGTQYAMLAGPSIGLRALNLTDGSLTPVSGPWDFTGMTGLDAVMRPGGRTLNDLAIGVVYNYGGDPLLKLYGSNGSLLDSAAPDSGLGTVNDLSLDLANNKIWYGTKLSSGEGCLFSDTYDFSRVAVIPPKLQFSRTGNNRYTFSYIGTPNFALQVATDIASPGWTTLTNQFTAVGTVCSTVLTNIASPGYYRLIR